MGLYLVIVTKIMGMVPKSNILNIMGPSVWIAFSGPKHSFAWQQNSNILKTQFNLFHSIIRVYLKLETKLIH